MKDIQKKNLKCSTQLNNWSQTLSSSSVFCPLTHDYPFSRLDSAILGADLLASMHSGDRILEVNGIPVCNASPDEVFAHVAIT